jgi:Flp pilus assembly pilin Flp
MIKRLLLDEAGVSALEYAILGSLVFLAIVMAVRSLGTTTSNTYNMLATQLAG